MTRVYQSFPVEDIRYLKKQMLNWANQFNMCCFLDNHEYESKHHSYECLVAAGAHRVFQPSGDFYSSLAGFDKTTNDWVFGHFSYELKDIERKEPATPRSNVGFPDFFLFVPEVVLLLSGSELTIGVLGQDVFAVFNQIRDSDIVPSTTAIVKFEPKLTRDEYIQNVGELIEHIKRGNCYEINFCQEFYARASINPEAIYNQLNLFSPNPLSAFYKLHNNFLLCSSPERYLSKAGNTIISQPIKGTLARAADTESDNRSRQQLHDSKKDQSENVMIVDLVRNDLSKICVEGSVKVEELFGIYSFPYVHQMISTISGSLKEDISISEVIKATFPMGSMTGAPKVKVMELIDKYEVSKRGIYSGAVGYISPQKNFDFNVVIRSIVYDQQTGHISYHVGSAITFYSDPVQEYEECLLKAKGISNVFRGSSAV